MGNTLSVLRCTFDIFVIVELFQFKCSTLIKRLPMEFFACDAIPFSIRVYQNLCTHKSEEERKKTLLS